jgi:hypothetical protein
VLGASLLAGLGQGTIAGIFLGVAGALVVWAFSSALVWMAAIPVLGRTADYAIVLRCLGFAYAWNSLAILGFLPLIGICVLALGIPVLLLFGVFR